MAEYKIKFVDKVLDNVHGFIGLTKLESKICDLPVFRRLIHIKQLGLANWVFPGAEHTRYIHSLGVMHIIDQMAIKLHYDDKERQIVRLAALLHDLGHYPLSHVGEAAYQSNTLKQEDSIILQCKNNTKEKIDALHNSENLNWDYMQVANNPYHHERITTLVIKHDPDIKRIIKECNCDEFIKIDDICAIITGDVEEKDYLSDKVQLLHSELDADRIDYLMRDATFSGTTYGGFELGLLFDNLIAEKYDGVKIVGIRPKGIPSADQFMLNRFFSYNQVIFNSHVSILGLMAQKVIEFSISCELLPSKEALINSIKSNDRKLFLSFTDFAFWSALKTLSENSYLTRNNHEIRLFVNKLMNFEDLKASDSPELRISVAQSDAYSKLSENIIYENCKDVEKHCIPIFITSKITKHVCQAQFENSLHNQERNADTDDELKRILTIRRLQDGLAVIDESTENISLLIDSERSIMPHIYDKYLYLLREYEM